MVDIKKDNKQEIKFTFKDYRAILAMAFLQGIIGWFLTLWDLAYAAVPMFITAILVGLRFKASVRKATLAGIIIGMTGGILVELALNSVRMNKGLIHWVQLTEGERFWLGVAEIIFNAALLGFFATFFSWGLEQKKNVEKLVEVNKPVLDTPGNNLNNFSKEELDPSYSFNNTKKIDDISNNSEEDITKVDLPPNP